ncbi:hypothetical protein KSP40_PGU006757 [Platanthera guangdongensis]|uniref:Uncharacterized protein n=1 Tax=Platanthera guangdongensis TaxID=2320717 RepID=A0ABR2MSC7_9ASPA
MDHILKDCAEYLCQMDEDDEPEIQIIPSPILDCTPSTFGYVYGSPMFFEGNDADVHTKVVTDPGINIIATSSPIQILSCMSSIHYEGLVPDFCQSITSPSFAHSTIVVSDSFVKEFLQVDAGTSSVVPAPIKDDVLQRVIFWDPSVIFSIISSALGLPFILRVSGFNVASLIGSVSVGVAPAAAATYLLPNASRRSIKEEIPKLYARYVRME